MCVKPTKLPHKLLPEKYWQKVPCGKCPECLSKRAINWATRIEHEMYLNEDNAFITLTYDDTKASNFDYHYSDFQKFIKRLRFRYAHKKIKHFTSIEYGGKNGRLHFHSILLNYYPTTRQHTIKPLKQTESGYTIYRSSELESLWEHGFSSVAPASAKTAYYIASYALSDSSYECPVSGEILSDKLRCSQGIGLDYFLKNKDQVINLALFQGHSIPRYYKKKLEQLDPEAYKRLTNEIDELKKTIQPRTDGYARLEESIAKSRIMAKEFRGDSKNYDNIKASLNDFEFTQGLNRRYGN